MRVCVGVCTAARPQMLAMCLDSLLLQASPNGCRVNLVIVDNNPEDDARGLVGQIAQKSQFPVHYAHERARGIATARNRVLDIAIDLDADWIAMIDDDEVASPTWLSELLEAAERYDADVIEGETTRRFPSPLPPFVFEYQPRCEPEGTRLQYAATNNVLFKSWIVRPEAAGLRFDETFNTTGAEDLDFFLRAEAKGARIIQATSAKAFETIPSSRLTLRSQLSRMAAEAATNAFIARQGRHHDLTILSCIIRAATRFTIGLGYVIVAPACRVWGARTFERAVVRGTRRIAWSVGTFRGLVGWLPKPYRRLQGY